MKHTALMMMMSMLFANSLMAQKRVQFFGGTVSEYSHPIQMSDGSYRGYYNNSQAQDRGYIVLNTSNKTFTIKWVNGAYDWVCKYDKIQTSKGESLNDGTTVNTMYKGNWVNGSQTKCLLLVTKRQTGDCRYTFKADKVVDKAIKIDAWRTVISFFTQGQCL